MKKDLSKCEAHEFECKVTSTAEPDCSHVCKEKKQKLDYLKERLQLVISLENRVSQLLLWRKYLDFLDSVETFVQIQSVNFEVPLHGQYIEAKEISVEVEMHLGFSTSPFKVKTTADVLANRKLLSSTLAQKIVEQVAIKLDVEVLETWKDLGLVEQLIMAAV